MLAKSIVFAGTALAFAWPAFAQDSPPPGGGGASGSAVLLQNVLFIGAMVAIFYFLLIRPQQRRQKEHRAMLEAVKRGDTIITTGGLIGKVTKVGETELSVELADNVRVRVVKSMIADVRDRGAPAPANDTKPD